MGAPFKNNFAGAANTGVAYVFSTEDGQFLIQLDPFDGADDNLFVYNVAVFGDTIVVGTKNSDSVYIYGLDGTLIQQIKAPDDAVG